MKKALLAIATVAATGLAHATPFTINTGTDFGANGSTNTSNINSLGFNFSEFTQVYDASGWNGTGFNSGTSVVLTNKQSVLNTYGFNTTPTSTLSGNAITPTYPVMPEGLDIDGISPGGDRNGFINGGGDVFPGDYVSGAWGLAYEYQLNGVTSGSGIQYTSGSYDIFYLGQIGADPTVKKLKVLTLNMNGAQLDLGNSAVSGTVSFDFTGMNATEEAFVKAFWNDKSPIGGTFFNITDPVKIYWTANNNVAPPVATTDNLFATNAGSPYYFRQGENNGTISFNVPEPGSIALVGLVLTGVAVASRRRKQA
jgi:PEP-CTERM motif